MNTSLKTCFKCGCAKSISEFYAHPQMADGHLNKCKECTRKDSHERETRLNKWPKWRLSEAARHREKSRRYRESGRAKPVSTEQKRAALAAYRERHPEKEAAHRKARAAIKSGKIPMKACAVCGFPIAEAHHEDYSKPLEVIWLCKMHHTERHVQKRQLDLLSA